MHIRTIWTNSKPFFGHLRFISGAKFDVNRPQEVMQWQNMTVDAIHAISLQFPATSGWNGYHQNLRLKIFGGVLVETLKIQKFFECLTIRFLSSEGIVWIHLCQYDVFIRLLYVERDGGLLLITATKRLWSKKISLSLYLLLLEPCNQPIKAIYKNLI